MEKEIKKFSLKNLNEALQYCGKFSESKKSLSADQSFQIQSFIELYRKGVHGIEHSVRVLNLVQKISELESQDETSKHTLEFCAVFHDIGRTCDGVDDFHGIKSVRQLSRNNFYGLKSFDTAIVRYIIENHCLSDEEGFGKVEDYNLDNFDEAIYLLKIFKDADGLDRVRLGDFDKRYLRTQSALSLVSYAEELYYYS